MSVFSLDGDGNKKQRDKLTPIKNFVGLPWWSRGSGLCAPNAGAQGSIPGQGTRSCMPQIRVHMLQLNILCAPTKTWCSQITFFFKSFV